MADYAGLYAAPDEYYAYIEYWFDRKGCFIDILNINSWLDKGI